jgi:hypothetical protein
MNGSGTQNQKRSIMKTKLLIGAILLCFCGLTLSAQQAELSGKALLDKMNSKARADQDYVEGYVQAIYAVYSHKSVLADEKEIKPIIAAAKKYLERNPDKLNQPASDLLKEVFARVSPPKKK